MVVSLLWWLLTVISRAGTLRTFSMAVSLSFTEQLLEIPIKRPMHCLSNSRFLFYASRTVLYHCYVKIKLQTLSFFCLSLRRSAYGQEKSQKHKSVDQA